MSWRDDHYTHCLNCNAIMLKKSDDGLCDDCRYWNETNKNRGVKV